MLLALPGGARGAIEPVATPVAVVTGAELVGLPETELAASGLALREMMVAGRDARAAGGGGAGVGDVGAGPAVLPVAAHAVPDAVGSAIVSAERAGRVLRETEALEGELGGLLSATLRPYQVRGVGWLRETVAEFGGAVLADEMGLGKTVQTIGLLAGRVGRPQLVVCPTSLVGWLRETVAEFGGAVLADEMGLGKTVQTIGLLAGRVGRPQLVVCPTSLVGNWTHEIAKFAPGLAPVAWRGGGVPTEANAVVVTGYPTLRLHGGQLSETHWGTVVFDEAQVLKNPRTQVAKAARALPTDARVALTGTPVENHLDELFALLNLTAPRLFAHRTQFRRRFVRPISEGSTTAAARLRDAIEPVVLGRKKIQVATALPAKIHSDLRCDLTEEQERVYDRVLANAIDEGFGAGAQRQSRVLAALTQLKQVCNHPGLITGDLSDIAGRSGKFDLCIDIVGTNIETGDPTLVFTQYRKTGELLVEHFANEFGVAAPFFHGGLSAADRAKIVADFQSSDGPQVLILSLRAAGTGLTLTRAADVIHFDRWWNPAVEAQASDRVHRIGQTRTVTVTTLTSATTVEEHIAAMHSRKSALTDLADSAGIAELARLDDDALVDILRRKREN
ncbi:hypothetical protein GCM10011591_10880 [Nocardia camponoti]|uniref:Helicase n=2 Tax=Nocardia camponoti TaxID=1616106 RepID=A0A917V5W0_9NOCA|nr:DEAD/DEAH box helicase [Nocardia camponoti]GGK41155.1 hypothetical protein GCM10011591_10880 [Nocardia camponoti]